MLVLTRSLGERIIISDAGHNVVCVITNLGMRGREIKLGFSAPQTTRIAREEIYVDPTIHSDVVRTD